MKQPAAPLAAFLILSLTACMNTDEKSAITPQSSPLIAASPLTAETAEAAWQVLEGGLVRELRQSWEPVPEPGFRPGIVRYGIFENHLVGVAVLDDAEIGNRATGLNERTWELGDVFEIFIQKGGHDPYFEFHITPENQHLQMRWPAAGTLQREAQAGTLNADDYLLPPPSRMQSKTWVDQAGEQWTVAFALPLSELAPENGTANGILRISFCRYDADGDGGVIFSSGTDLPFAGFHELEFWPEYRLPE